MKNRNVGLVLLAACITLIACEDTSNSRKEACGNGLLDLGEACDGAAGEAPTCEQLGYYGQTGEVGCGADCQWDLSVCSDRCGDGVIQSVHGEQCEGEELGGQSCVTLGYAQGALACTDGCRYDLAGCESAGVCGDGVIEDPEMCDGVELGGETCESLGYYGGSLGCDMDCRLDLSACQVFGRCGDGEIQTMYGEVCEGSDLAGQTCETLGFYGGALTCAVDCRFDQASCEVAGRCGDGLVQEAQEECDGSELAGQTCEALGLYAGTLACDDCRLNPDGCGGRCGDGILQSAHETCDGAELGGESCRTQSFFTGPLACDPAACSLDPAGCLNITELVAGHDHNCALLTDGTVRCWGHNNAGQLGDGTFTDRTAPVQVTGLSGVTRLAAGWMSTCALLTDGTVRCWGANSFGQLGDGSDLDQALPVAVSGLSTVTYIDVGYGHSCAVKTDGTAWCWGLNNAGQLGIGTTTSTSTPVQVSGLTTVQKLACGYSFTCAVLTDKSVRCWGENGYGQLGIGHTTDTYTPVTPAIGNVSSIVAGQEHVCVTTSTTVPVSRDGYCWGFNNYGQLGNGTTTNSLVPTQINYSFSSTRTYFLSTGTTHTCMGSSASGLYSTAFCWGRNDDGRLGDGTTTNRLSPVDTGVTAARLAAGFSHTCVASGSSVNLARCWGVNGYGQLGDGTHTNSLSAVTVLP